MIDFDKGSITYGPRCTYCIISDKGYWHWTHALIYTAELKKALCGCTKRED